MILWTFSDGCSDVGEVELGHSAGRVQETGGAVRGGNHGRLDDGDQTQTAVLVADRGRRLLRQADRDGRHDGVHSGSDGGRAQGQPVRGRRGPGRVRSEARLENVSTVLRRGAGSLPRRVRPGPRSAALTPAYVAAFPLNRAHFHAPPLAKPFG